MMDRAVPRALLFTTFGLVFALYWATLCPTVHWGDSGELITAAYVGGISHPPGQPLYTMLGWLFTHLPALPSPAYGMNLLSAFCGAAAWTLVASWCWQVLLTHGTPRTAAGVAAVAAALTGAAGGIAWYQAVIAENTTLHAVFMAALLWWAWWLGTNPAADDRHLLKRMLGWAFVYGLSAANHPAGVFLFPAFAGWFLWTCGARLLRPQWVAAMGVSACAGLIPYAYLYFASRSNPPLDWGNPETWENFRWVISADLYRSDAVRELSFTALWRGAWQLVQAVGREWGIVGAGVMVLGWVRLWRMDRALAVWPLAAFAVFVYLAANPAYINAYLVPLFLMLVPCLASAFAALLCRTQVRGPVAASVGVLMVCMVPLLAGITHQGTNNLRGDDLAFRYGRHVLGDLPPRAVVIVESPNLTFISLYLRWCEAYRPDLVVLSASAFSRPGYRATAMRNFPDVVWPKTQTLLPEVGEDAENMDRVARTTNPWWIRSLLLSLYEQNADERRFFWETPTSYGTLLPHFAQAGYLFELRRPLAEGRRAAWEGTAPASAEFVAPEPWDPRVATNPTASAPYGDVIGVVAEIQRMRGELATAADLYDHALDLDSKKPWLWTNYGVVLNRLDRSADAEAALRQAIRLRPDDGMYHANLTGYYVSHNRLVEALASSRATVRAWREPPWSVLFQAAQLELAAGEPARALDVLVRAHEARPDHAPTAIDLATLALRQHEPEIAEPAVAAALEFMPESAHAWFNAAWLAAEQGKPDAVLREYVARAVAADEERGRRLCASHPTLRPFIP